MLLTVAELKDLVVEIATRRFGVGEFRRRPLLLAVEAHILENGAWTPSDDEPRSSGGLKSEGEGAIDWAITRLLREGRLVDLGRDRWRLPASQP
ncbi:hypothetical protein SBV1_460056 [Verrucomicrobia bacterium]|nr:hypothetical protein SBV1_460056 [Verrucomicrobiota bacterium]